jgi:creatinine amidohydrolase
MHGGLLSVCTAMWLCPENVNKGSMGSDIPQENYLYVDYIGWDKLTEDGCWGKFEEGSYTEEQLRDKGKMFWETFIEKRTEGLKQILDEAYRRKMAK